MPEKSNFFTLNRVFPIPNVLDAREMPKDRRPANPSIPLTLGALRQTSKLQKEHTIGHGTIPINSLVYVPVMHHWNSSTPLANQMQGLT
jgi:hypothetical protein